MSSNREFGLTHLTKSMQYRQGPSGLQPLRNSIKPKLVAWLRYIIWFTSGLICLAATGCDHENDNLHGDSTYVDPYLSPVVTADLPLHITAEVYNSREFVLCYTLTNTTPSRIIMLNPSIEEGYFSTIFQIKIENKKDTIVLMIPDSEGNYGIVKIGKITLKDENSIEIGPNREIKDCFVVDLSRTNAVNLKGPSMISYIINYSQIGIAPYSGALVYKGTLTSNKVPVNL